MFKCMNKAELKANMGRNDMFTERRFFNLFIRICVQKTYDYLVLDKKKINIK